MKDYKRLTTRGVNGRAYYATPFTSNSMQEIYEEDVKKMQEVMERLCELEEKIENGTLVEFPRVIHPNRAEWFVQYQYPNGVVQYYICFSEAEAEAMLLQLKGDKQ